MREMCIVHLVRAHNGIDPFRQFLASYQSNPGGIEHDLLIVFKGFCQSQDKSEYNELLVPFQHAVLDVSDEGFDITAYFAAAKRYSEQYRYFCFLNSYSVILDCDWLRKLHEHISLPGVGLVGATGSWQSLSRWGRILQPRGKQVYGNLISDRKMRLWKRVNNVAATIWRFFCYLIFFYPFPNYHLRTNAFMIASDSMKKLSPPIIKTKFDAYKFESGKNGLTRQVLNTGKEVLVVGKNGVGYKMESWNRSNTFRQADQENLLVSDNQTRAYQNSNLEQRKYLFISTWGIKSKTLLDTCYDCGG